MDFFLVSLASLLAGFIDSIVGGGGLVLVPALFAIYPTTPPATLFGINKSASIWGTGIATWQYQRRVSLRWPTVLPAAAAGFTGAFAGAWAVTQISPEFLRRLLPLILIGVLIYTLARKELGRHHAPRFSGLHETAAISLIGLSIGFYDGFFGPGTGSFLIFLFVRFFGFDFLHASAASKVVNVATNLAALAFFVPHGHVLPLLAVLMAGCNVLGSFIGAHLALRHGSGFVRKAFLCVVGVFILKFAYDTFA